MKQAPGSRAPATGGDLSRLRRRVARLLVVRASGHLLDAQRRYPRWELDNTGLQRLLREGVGGVILLGGSAAEVALRTRQLEAWAGQPLLLCADVEEGVGQRFEGASWLVPPLALGLLCRDDPAGARRLAGHYGRCCGREARALGLNWVLAPVCDVNNNPANPVINVRAWGEDPATVGALAAAFLQGAQAEGVLCCAKHFPGHGDTDTDSHLGLPSLPHDRSRLERIELPPFRAAIAAGVASVMTGHLLLPALDPRQPATLSRAVLSGLLRRELGFGGLIVTDALVMEAIAALHGPGEAAVLALEAGADLVLMPADADSAMEAILEAVLQGRLDAGSIEARCARRRRALQGLPASAAASGRSAAEPLGPLSQGPLPQDRDLARHLVEITLRSRSDGRSTPDTAPAAAAAGGINLIRVDSVLGCPFLSTEAPAIALPESDGFRTRLTDRHIPPPWKRLVGGEADGLNLDQLAGRQVLLQLFVRGNPFRGSAAGGEEPWAALIRGLQAHRQLAGVAVYGSPYLWEQLLPVLAEDVPAAWSPGQMPLAQRTVLEHLGIGRTAAGAAETGRGRVPTQAGFTD